MTDGIPIVYYGQEQGMHGNSDPYNREALWPSGYQNTTAVRLITKLNTLRQRMVKTDNTYLTHIHLVDYNNRHRHSEGICHLHHHYHRFACTSLAIVL